MTRTKPSLISGAAISGDSRDMGARAGRDQQVKPGSLEAGPWKGAMTTASLTKHAHDPGDPQVASHCPFCGSGAIVGRSDGTIACDMCGMNFLIRVQPAYPGMPQAPGEGMAPTDVAGDMGMGLQAPPGDELAPGQEELGPDGEPLEPGDELEPGEEGAEDEGGPPWAEESDGEDEAEEEGPPPPKSKKKSSRRTADFRQVGPVASDDLQAHLMSHHGWSAEDLRDAMAGNSGPWEEANLANHHDWDHSEYTPAMIPGSSRVLPGGVIPHMHSGQYDRYGPERLLPYSLSVKAPPRTYLTLSGARLTEDAYVRHLACLHSGNSPQVLAKLRSQAALQMIIAAKTAASPVALAPLGHEDICEPWGAPSCPRVTPWTGAATTTASTPGRCARWAPPSPRTAAPARPPWPLAATWVAWSRWRTGDSGTMRTLPH